MPILKLKPTVTSVPGDHLPAPLPLSTYTRKLSKDLFPINCCLC